jgi:hypothetical protein
MKASFKDVTKGVETGDIRWLDVDIKSANHPLRVALAYSDYPGPALVNNLNLILRSPRGRDRVGNENVNESTAVDVHNNAEAVRVDRAQAGLWRVAVVGSNVPRGPQPFAIAILGAQ